MKLKSFKYWKHQEVHETFGIRRLKTSDLLEAWLNSKVIPTKQEKKQLEKLQEKLRENVLAWNEAELKFNFLTPLIQLIDYETDDIRPFLERSLILEKDGKKCTGTADFLIAQGKQIPRAAYFCIHEYKPEPGTGNDPLAQLLLGMLAAQVANQEEGKDIPIYGAYVVGRSFHFVVFQGAEYALSDLYAATRPDIFDIFSILSQLKQYIAKNSQ